MLYDNILKDYELFLLITKINLKILIWILNRNIKFLIIITLLIFLNKDYNMRVYPLLIYYIRIYIHARWNRNKRKKSSYTLLGYLTGFELTQE